MADTTGKTLTGVRDEDVVALSSDAVQPLLPVLEQSRSLRPLIAVLAVLPGFMALERHGMDDFSSVWALRALSCFESGGFLSFLDPGETGRTAGLSSQPPLATWLTTAVLAVFGPTITHAPLMVPLLSAAGCVWWTFRLFRETAGPRKGFWAAVLVSTSGSLLLLATNTAPSALTLFLILVVLDSWQRHFRQRKGNVSGWLLLAGTALGLCLLSGGPVVLAVSGVLLLKPVIERLLPAPKPARPGRYAKRPPRLDVALGVALLTAFTIGGWWLMRAAGSNNAFWSDWFNGYEAPTLDAAGARQTSFEAFSPPVSRAVRLCVVFGPILPLSVYGFLLILSRGSESGDRTDASSAGRDSVRGGSQQPGGSPALLLSWLFVAVAYHLMAPGWSAGHGTGRTLSDAFLLIPAIGLAAYAVDAILQRQTTVREVFLLTAVMFVVLPVLPSWEHGQTPPLEPALPIVVGILAASLLIAWRSRHWIRERESRKRIALGTLMTAQLCAVVLGCVMSLASQPRDDSRLVTLRDRVPPDERVSRIVLVTDAVPPARLEYMLRSIKPQAGWNTVGVRNVTADVGKIVAETPPQNDVLFVEWLSVDRQATVALVRERKLVAVDTPRFYRGRELRISLLKPQDESLP